MTALSSWPVSAPRLEVVPFQPAGRAVLGMISKIVDRCPRYSVDNDPLSSSREVRRGDMPGLASVRGQPAVVLVRSKTSRRNGTGPTHEECASVVIDWRSPPGTGHVLYLVRRTTGGACHTL